MRGFWWGQKHQEAKIAWVDWKQMCYLKSRGGLGFRNLQAFNLAMLAKQAWRILTNPSSLIARVLKARYFPTGDILSATLGSSPSYSWRSIFNSLGVIERVPDGVWAMENKFIYGTTNGSLPHQLTKSSPLPLTFQSIQWCLLSLILPQNDGELK